MINRLSRLRKPLYRIGVVIGLALLIYQIFLGWQAVRLRYIQAPNLWLLLLATLCVLVGILQQVTSWMLIMRAMGIRLPVMEGASGYTLSFVSRYIPGSIWGYLGRGEWLWQRYQISYSISNTASIIEVGLIVLTDLWVVGFSLVFAAGIQVQCIYLILSLLALVITWWILLKLVRSNWGKQRLLSNLKGINLLTTRSWLIIVGLLVLNWIFYGLAVYLVGQALGMWAHGFDPGRWISLIGYYGLAWLGAFLALFLPAGLGLREFLLTQALTTAGGLLASQASALSVVTRFLFTLAELFTVVIALLWKAYSFRSERGSEALR